jgi:hypothetical protein
VNKNGNEDRTGSSIERLVEEILFFYFSFYDSVFKKEQKSHDFSLCGSFMLSLKKKTQRWNGSTCFCVNESMLQYN